MAKRKLILYSTDGCHLCDQALSLINSSAHASNLDIEVVDIALSEELMTLYGVHIPVLREMQREEKLFWPFDESQLSTWLSV
ncbi:glutaredoxin family protein [Zooshikella harenae]|uniref:Glutaredoxin family protein n=1 Tax=Zooshikella harenae TaxID=2827238 RepID=A0ABS5ZIH5_9GAMM|nr:glutaredoxin family protein [Zooshikella harenae]MBU2713837.1 glutaredoxin family protein [Zooshikella harenae]